jgi:hypothetical protein
MYHLGTPSKLKSMIYQMKKKHNKIKSSMNDSCLQVDGHGTYAYFFSCMRQLNDKQQAIVDHILYKRLKILQNFYIYFL